MFSRFTSAPVDASMMLRSYEHQFETSTYRPSGVVATYFGTVPTGTTLSIDLVATLIR